MAENVVEVVIRAKDQTGPAAKAAEQNIAGLATRLGAVVGGVAGVTQALTQSIVGALQAIPAELARTVTETARLSEELLKASAATGQTVESLSQLSFAAKQSETDFGAVTVGLRFLQRAQVDAVQGNKETAASFERLGISVEELSRLDAREALLRVAEGLEGVGDAAERTRLRVALFGRGGNELASFLSGGREQIEAFTREADRMGATISTTTAVLADTFADQLQAVQDSLAGTRAQIATALLPALIEIGKIAVEAARGLSELVRAVGPWLASAARDAALVFRGLASAIASTGPVLAALPQLVLKSIPPLQVLAFLLEQTLGRWIDARREFERQATINIGGIDSLEAAEQAMAQVIALKLKLHETLANPLPSGAFQIPGEDRTRTKQEIVELIDLNGQQVQSIGDIIKAYARLKTSGEGIADPAADSLAKAKAEAEALQRAIAKIVAESKDIRQIKFGVDVAKERAKVEAALKEQSDFALEVVAKAKLDIEPLDPGEIRLPAVTREIDPNVEEFLNSLGIAEESVTRILGVIANVQEGMRGLGQTGADVFAGLAAGFEAFSAYAAERFSLVAEIERGVFESLHRFATNFADSFADAFDQIVFAGKNVFDSIGNFMISAGKLVERLIRDIAYAIIRALALKAVLSVIGGPIGLLADGGTVGLARGGSVARRLALPAALLAAGGSVAAPSWAQTSAPSPVFAASGLWVVPGATQRNDVVPAMLSPGEVVLPTVDSKSPAEIVGDLAGLRDLLHSEIVNRRPAELPAVVNNVNIEAFDLDALRDMLRHGDLRREELRRDDLGR